jgi:hypothetical protein
VTPPEERTDTQQILNCSACRSKAVKQHRVTPPEERTDTEMNLGSSAMLEQLCTHTHTSIRGLDYAEHLDNVQVIYCILNL